MRMGLMRIGDGSKLSFNREGGKQDFGRVSTLLLLILVQESRAQSMGIWPVCNLLLLAALSWTSEQDSVRGVSVSCLAAAARDVLVSCLCLLAVGVLPALAAQAPLSASPSGAQAG